MKEKFGNLKELKELGKTRKHPYTIEQIINPTLKCTNGENMIEVKKRMKEVINEIVQRNGGTKVAIVSHGAAIKFYLTDWCSLKENSLFYQNKEIKLESPSAIKLVFYSQHLKEIETI